MMTRRTVSRILLTLGCVLLLVAAAVHCLAYLKFSAPAVHASNLPIPHNRFRDCLSLDGVELDRLCTHCTGRHLRANAFAQAHRPDLRLRCFASSSIHCSAGGVLHRKRNDRCRILVNHYRLVVVPGSPVESYCRAPPPTNRCQTCAPIDSRTITSKPE